MTDLDDAADIRLRRTLARVPAYRRGPSADAAAGVTAYTMSLNENPYPPLPGVLEAATEALAEMNRYPDMFADALVARLAEHHGVAPDGILVAAGSSALLSQIVTATCEEGDEVVHAWRSFEAYPVMTALSGASGVEVPLDAEGRHDLAAMADSVTSRTSLILLCTPNNPTGPAIHGGELDAFLGAVPRDVLVVIDEAYVEFNDDPAAADGFAALRAHPNVVLLRTMSKAYGLAGLRVGYAVARPPVAAALRKCAVPFAVGSVAQACAIASLDRRDELAARVRWIVGERDRVAVALRAAGWSVPDSRANFVWVPAGDHAAEVAAEAGAAGLSVRAFPGEGVRVSIDEQAANDGFVALATRFRASMRERPPVAPAFDHG